MPLQQTPQGVAQPVKKRGRFSNISSHREQNLPTHQRNVPAGFVRDLLDEEDSEDDPDFDCDIELSEDEDDAFDELPEPDFPLENQPAHDASLHPRVHHPQALNDTIYTLNQQLPCEDPEFEVDPLDSTDDEQDDDNFRENLPQHQHTSHPQQTAKETELINFGDIELNSEDDEDDPDFEAVIDRDELRHCSDLCKDENEPAQSEARDNEYVQFLMSLLKDDENTPRPQVESAQQTPANSLNRRLPDVAPGFTGEDDDDFDYLRASAMIQDDPLEYRDDLLVSRKEVAQLLFQNNESNLRRQTRMLRTKKATAQQSVRNQAGQKDGSISMQSLPAHPGPSHPAQTTETILAAAHRTQQPPNSDRPIVVPRPQLTPQLSSFMSLTPVQASRFGEQFDVYMQILTHVHAVCKKKARSSTDNTASAADNGDPDAQCDALKASEKSGYLLRRILHNHRVTGSYHRLMKSHISTVRALSEGLVQCQSQALFSHETGRRSAYDKPVIGLIEPFLSDCETAEVESMPGSVLKPFAPYERRDIQQALTTRTNPRQYTMSGAQEGWFTWTVPDDNLLALTIAKYGRECGDYVRDLLPHRVEEDCRVRVRYLASRRCKDNPVKRQVLHVSAPLSKDEIRLVEAGLRKFGGTIDDPDLWKQIQRHLVPTREWSHLQKLWLWRETRRKYKATYRAKMSKKKTVTQETVVR